VLFVSASFLFSLDADSLTFSDGFFVILLCLGPRQHRSPKYRLWKTYRLQVIRDFQCPSTWTKEPSPQRASKHRFWAAQG